MTASDTSAASQPLRPRRSCLAVPSSNPRFLEKAQIEKTVGLPVGWIGIEA